MTPHQDWLDTLIAWCECGQKNHAWHMAKQMAEQCPHLLSGLPEELKAEMLARKSADATTETGRTNE